MKLTRITICVLLLTAFMAGQTTTPNIHLYQPAQGQTNWATQINNNWLTIDSLFGGVNGRALNTNLLKLPLILSLCLATDSSGNVVGQTCSAGSVTGVSSANADIGVSIAAPNPVLTLNSGTGANQIVKLNGSGFLPALNGSLLTALNAANVTGALANGVTATTQTVGDNSNLLATDAFVLANAGTSTPPRLSQRQYSRKQWWSIYWHLRLDDELYHNFDWWRVVDTRSRRYLYVQAGTPGSKLHQYDTRLSLRWNHHQDAIFRGWSGDAADAARIGCWTATRLCGYHQLHGYQWQLYLCRHYWDSGRHRFNWHWCKYGSGRISNSHRNHGCKQSHREWCLRWMCFRRRDGHRLSDRRQHCSLHERHA